ncbi:MAG: NINE protein [Gemmatimonadota bacterium]|nr:MAG: NINE protein [Gemmatimonadota bacterium]
MSENVSDKSRGVALALATIIGPFGAHRFYVGKVSTGILQLATFGGLGIWWLYDWILVLAGGFRDANDRRVVKWLEDESLSFKADPDTAEKMELLLDEMYNLREEMGDLSERVDFMERMLSRARERDRLSPG